MNNILENSNIEDFNKFIREAVSPFHTTESAKKRLKLKGFKELKAGEDFDIRAGEKYYIDIDFARHCIHSHQKQSAVIHYDLLVQD